MFRLQPMPIRVHVMLTCNGFDAGRQVEGEGEGEPGAGGSAEFFQLRPVEIGHQSLTCILKLT